MKLKKKLYIGLLAGTVMATSIPTFAEETLTLYQPKITIQIDGQTIETDVAPEIKESKTYVPISFIAKELGASTKWESPKTTIEKDGVTLEFEIDKCGVIRNGVKYPNTTATYIKDGRTMVPLRVVSEFLGCRVEYEAKKKIVSITKGTGIAQAPEIDISDFTLSPDGKWGTAFYTYYKKFLNAEQTRGTEREVGTLYLLNVETNDVQKLRDDCAELWCHWSEDSKLGIHYLPVSYVFSTLDGGEDQYELYDPITDKTIQITEEAYIKIRDAKNS